MNNKKKYDVIIIGKGVLGLSTAFRLISEKEDISIAIVAPDSVGEHGEGSDAAGAMLGCFGEVTDFGMASKEGKIKHELAYKASKIWPIWLNEINQMAKLKANLVINSGTFIVSNSKSGNIEDDNMFSIENSLKKYNEAYENVSFKDIPGFNPESDSRPIKTLYLPNEGSIDSRSVLKYLKAALIKSNLVTFIDDLVIRIDTNFNSNHVVKCNTSSLRGDVVIVAAGASSEEIISKSSCLNKSIQKIFSGTGSSLVVSSKNTNIKHVIRTPNRSFSCGLHTLPLNSDNIYVGATNVINHKPQLSATLSDTYFLIECLLEQINHKFESNTISQIRTGNRSISSDTFPLVGETNIDGIYLLTGAYRDGFHLSPLYSEYITDLILQKTNKYKEWIFSPKRKIINSFSKEESISQTIKYYLSVAYEHNIKTPKVGWVSMIEEMITDKVNSLYNQLTNEIILPPDFFSLVDLNREEMIPFFNDYYERFDPNR